MSSDEPQRSAIISALRHQITCMLVAVRFLTILPIMGGADDDSNYFTGALYYFGATGILSGSLVGLCGWVLLQLFPPLVVAALLTVLLSLISGFLHLDGLADTADGFMSGTPTPLCLDIMRDSRIGVMGAAAIGSLLLIKGAALASIGAAQLVPALIMASLAGRTAIVLAMALLPYARSDGLGALFYGGAKKSAALLNVLLLLVCLMPLRPELIIVTLGMYASAVAGFFFICRRKIGGATGDTLGALCEITEAAVLLCFTYTH